MAAPAAAARMARSLYVVRPSLKSTHEPPSSIISTSSLRSSVEYPLCIECGRRGDHHAGSPGEGGVKSTAKVAWLSRGGSGMGQKARGVRASAHEATTFFQNARNSTHEIF